MPRATQPSRSPVAEICLYGNMEVGAGWIVSIANGTKCGLLLGDGDPVKDRPMTAAVWLAVEAIKEKGVVKGTVRIFMAGGARCADVELSKPIPYFGELPWTAAPVYMVSAEAIAAAAEPQ